MTTTENEQRDELAAIYVDTLDHGHGRIGRPEQGRRAAVAILTAGYIKPRIITTAEEWEALAEGSIIRDMDGGIYETLIHAGGRRHWFKTGHASPYAPQGDFEATVVWEPGAGVGA